VVAVAVMIEVPAVELVVIEILIVQNLLVVEEVPKQLYN